MASESVILELLRQEEAKRNQPSQAQLALSQVMQGITQGIQLYDSIKGIQTKYGTSKKIPIDAGSPAVPAVPPTVETRPAMMTPPSDSLRAGSMVTPTPQFSDFASALNLPAPTRGVATETAPGSPAIPAIPPTFMEVKTPGTLDVGREAELLKALQWFSGAGVNAATQASLNRLGVQGSIQPAEKVAVNPSTGEPMFTMGRRDVMAPVTETPVMTQAQAEIAAKKGETIEKGTRILPAEKKEGTGKNPQEELTAALGRANDDAVATATKKTGIRGEVQSPVWEAAFKDEYLKLANQYAGQIKGLSKADIQSAIQSRFINQQEVATFRQTYAAQIASLKKNVQTNKTTGTWTPAQDASMRAALQKMGTPEPIIIEILSAQ